MRSFLEKTRLVGLAVVVAIGFVASVMPSDNANAQVGSLYGRPEFAGYFSGLYTSQFRYSCSSHNEGYLFCNGIHSNNVQEFLEFYHGNVWSSDTQNQRAAAFTILAMLGVNGPDTGGADNGVNMARARFPEWEARVRSYNAAGRINFNTMYSYGTNTAYRGGDILWRNNSNTEPSIVFTLMNGSQVAIKRSCANLVGAAELPAMDYNLSASSSVNRSSAAPGQRITWSHELRNNGSGATSQNTYSHLGMSGFSNGWGTGLHGENTPAGAGIGPIRGFAYNLHDVTQNDVGNKLCQWVEFDPTNATGGRDGRSVQACVEVPYNYTLVPTISNIEDGRMIESSAGTIPVQGRVSNSSVTKSHTNIQWQVTQIRYSPTASIPNRTGGQSPSNPCGFFAGGTCTAVSSGVEANGYGNNAAVAYAANGTLGDEPVGTRLCYAMSVQRISSSSENWGHSRLHCMVVGKRPKIQVYGGDVIVGRGYDASGVKLIKGITTSSSNKSGTYYGSHSEYAIIPSGLIVGMASASGYANGTTSNNLCSGLSLLSFANKPAASAASCNTANIGRYSLPSASQYDAVRARFAAPAGAATLTGNVDVASLSPSTIYLGSGNINLSSSSAIPAGKWVIINAPTASVRITSNIQYADTPFTSTGEIPQLVIIANNIVIDDGVGQVDSWLYAKGTGVNGVVNTCDAEGVDELVNLTSDVCATKLTINGPVISTRLLLNRTHGSGVGEDSGTPAEIFNLRPDAYMWASSFSGVGTKARTVISTELPPRF